MLGGSAGQSIPHNPVACGGRVFLFAHGSTPSRDQAVDAVTFDQGFAADLEGFELAGIDQLMQLGVADAESFAGFPTGKSEF